MKIAYNVTIKVEHEVKNEWLKWMKEVHLQDMLKTGKFLSYRMMKLLGHDDEDGVTYGIQYVCERMEELKEYQAEYAAELQAAHASRFKDKYIAFRTIMVIIEEERIEGS